MFGKKIGIDLGTANTVVFVPGRGFIINEPTIVALTVPENTVLAVGAEAKEMIGRTPDEIIAYRPLKDGVVADYYITKAMLTYFISMVLAGWYFSENTPAPVTAQSVAPTAAAAVVASPVLPPSTSVPQL